MVFCPIIDALACVRATALGESNNRFVATWRFGLGHILLFKL